MSTKEGSLESKSTISTDLPAQGSARKLVAFVVGASLLVSGCSGDDMYFQALAGDPMAEYQPPATEVERRSENPATGFIARGRSAPHILSEYRVLDMADPEAVLEETVKYAMAAGWVFDETEPHATPTGNLRIVGTKDLGLSVEGELRLSLSKDRDEFSLRLTYPQAIP